MNEVPRWTFDHLAIGVRFMQINKAIAHAVLLLAGVCDKWVVEKKEWEKERVYGTAGRVIERERAAACI